MARPAPESRAAAAQLIRELGEQLDAMAGEVKVGHELLAEVEAAIADGAGRGAAGAPRRRHGARSVWERLHDGVGDFGIRSVCRMADVTRA